VSLNCYNKPNNAAQHILVRNMKTTRLHCIRVAKRMGD
jgi:hypothetical protein